MQSASSGSRLICAPSSCTLPQSLSIILTTASLITTITSSRSQVPLWACSMRQGPWRSSPCLSQSVLCIHRERQGLRQGPCLVISDAVVWIMDRFGQSTYWMKRPTRTGLPSSPGECRAYFTSPCATLSPPSITCMLVISGCTMPSRHPLRPIIGLDSRRASNLYVGGQIACRFKYPADLGRGIP